MKRSVPPCRSSVVESRSTAATRVHFNGRLITAMTAAARHFGVHGRAIFSKTTMRGSPVLVFQDLGLRRSVCCLHRLRVQLVPGAGECLRIRPVVLLVVLVALRRTDNVMSRGSAC